MRAPSIVLPLAFLLAAAPLAAAETGAAAGWLGVMLDDPQEARSEENATVQPGVRVRGIVAEGPAEQARLRAQDRILAMDGEGVTTSGELMARLRALPPGTRIVLTVQREGREFEASARLGERPEGKPIQLRRGWIGVSAIALPPSLREHFGAPATAGVMVATVEAGSPAESAGLRVGDVVVAVAGQEVRSPGALAAMVAEIGIENRVEIDVIRSGADLVLEPVVAAAPDPREKAAVEDGAPRE